MQPHSLVAIVTVLALFTYLWISVRVGLARRRSGVAAPATTGDPGLERAYRIQANTLEWLPVFLPGLWLFALYWSDLVAAILGLVWIAGRILYALGYAADPNRRGPGFLIQAAAAVILLLGGLGGALRALAVTGA